MAKQFLDYTGLEHYDGKIKAWANNKFAKTGFNNVAFGTNVYATSSLNDTIKFAGSAVSSLTSATGTVTLNLTDEHTTLDGHYSPEGTTATAVTATKLSGSIGAGSSIDAVVGVSKDPKGHIVGLTTKTVSIPAAISDSTVSDNNTWVDITIVEKGGKLESVNIDDTAIDALPKAAFNKITIGSTSIEADSAADTLTLAAGSNITLTPDVDADKVTIAANMDFTSLDSGVSGSGTYVTVGVTQTDGKLTSLAVNDSAIDTAIGALPKVAFKTIKVGSTSIVADSATDTLTIAADSNITLTPDANTDKVTIKANYSDLDATKGAKGTYVGVTVTQTDGKIESVTVDDSAIDALPKVAFKTIVVGSTNIVADLAADTLTLAAGSNITLTPDVTNDKVTIAANMDFSSLDAKKGGKGTYVGVTVTETDGKIASVTVDDSAIEKAINSLTQSIQGGTHFRGLTTSTISDGSTATVITIDNVDYTANAGDIVILSGNKKEFIFTGSSWLELGDSSAEAAAITELRNNLSTLSGTVTNIGNKVDTLPTVAFKTIKVGSTSIVADDKADTLTLVGDVNITLTPDATKDEVKIKANYSDLDSVAGGKSTYVGVTVTQVDGLITSVTVSDTVGTAIQTAVDPLPKLAFKTIKVGSTSIEADSAADTLTLAAGSNITLTPDVDADKVTIAANMDFSSLDAKKGGKGTYVGVTVTETDGKITSVTVNDSAIDTKLNTLPQVAFKTITIGSTNIVADLAADTLTLVGDGNITLTPDATNDKITIKANYSDLDSSKGANGTYVGVTVTQTDGKITGVTVNDSVIDGLLTEAIPNATIDNLFA